MIFNTAFIWLGLGVVLCPNLVSGSTEASEEGPMDINLMGVVEVAIESCVYCGMSTAKGNISLSVCDWRGFCCDTGLLDNGNGTDFNKGTVNSFVGNEIGHCNGFNLSKTTSNISMTLSHSGKSKSMNWYYYNIMTISNSGQDDIRLAWVRVVAAMGSYKCYFKKRLAGMDFEDGFRCQFFLGPGLSREQFMALDWTFDVTKKNKHGLCINT